MKRKGLRTVIYDLKQRMLAKSAKVRRYEHRTEQFRQNKIFDFDQKKMYAKFNGGGVRPNQMMYLTLKKVKDFGVIFGASPKDITEKQNG